MKRIYTLLGALFVVLTAAVAQPKIEFDNTSKEVGYVLWRIPTTITYNFKNTGNQPLVISNINTSCACSKAEWTKTPVESGGSGIIKVTFDAEAIGHFYKDLEVYCNAAPHLFMLDFNGEVTADSKNYMFTHPFAFGAIRMNKKTLEFGDVKKGVQPTVEILIANSSNKSYIPALMHLPPYLKVKAEPAVLPRGKAGKLYVTLLSDELPEYGLNKAELYLSRYMGDKVCKDNKINFSALLLPATSQTDARAPKMKLSVEQVAFTSLRPNQKKVQTIEITNVGQSDLKIEDVQLFGKAMAVSIKSTHLKPGAKTKMKITWYAKYMEERKEEQKILFITNSPEQTKVYLPVSGSLAQ